MLSLKSKESFRVLVQKRRFLGFTCCWLLVYSHNTRIGAFDFWCFFKVNEHKDSWKCWSRWTKQNLNNNNNVKSNDFIERILYYNMNRSMDIKKKKIENFFDVFFYSILHFYLFSNCSKINYLTGINYLNFDKAKKESEKSTRNFDSTFSEPSVCQEQTTNRDNSLRKSSN